MLRVTEAGRAVVTEVATEWGVAVADVIGTRRHWPLPVIRRVAAVRLRARGYTPAQIGRELGGRHYQSVLAYLREAARRRVSE